MLELWSEIRHGEKGGPEVTKDFRFRIESRGVAVIKFYLWRVIKERKGYNDNSSLYK